MLQIARVRRARARGACGAARGCCAPKSGLSLRAVGANAALAPALAINPWTYILAGLALANGLSALAGAVAVQLQGFADVHMGFGVLINGLAAVIIGETLVGRHSVHAAARRARSRLGRLLPARLARPRARTEARRPQARHRPVRAGDAGAAGAAARRRARAAARIGNKGTLHAASISAAIDHVVILVRDLDRARDAYAAARLHADAARPSHARLAEPLHHVRHRLCRAARRAEAAPGDAVFHRLSRARRRARRDRVRERRRRGGARASSPRRASPPTRRSISRGPCGWRAGIARRAISHRAAACGAHARLPAPSCASISPRKSCGAPSTRRTR